MRLAIDLGALLDVLTEPSIIVDRAGQIVSLNRRAKSLLGADAAGRMLHEFQAGEVRKLHDFLDRCIGASGPFVGAWRPLPGGRLRWRGARISLADQPHILLRVDQDDEKRFAALNQKIVELNREVKERRRAEAVLAETLRDRDILLRELQHRVKNNMHMLSSLLRSAERETTSAEAKEVLRDAAMRFSAVNAVHQLIYGADELERIDSTALIRTLAHAAAQLAPERVQVDLDVTPSGIPIQSAVAVALVINELLTNAVKYGRPAHGRPVIRVTWRNSEEKCRLVVQDNGPGFALPESAKRASGIGLIRGLLRQLGGSLQVERDGGARCMVEIPLPGRERQ